MVRNRDRKTTADENGIITIPKTIYKSQYSNKNYSASDSGIGTVTETILKRYCSPDIN